MTVTPADALELLRKIRYDLTAAQAKVTDAINAVAALPPLPSPDAVLCPECGLALPSVRRLREHRWNVHEVPEEAA